MVVRPLRHPFLKIKESAKEETRRRSYLHIHHDHSPFKLLLQQMTNWTNCLRNNQRGVVGGRRLSIPLSWKTKSKRKKLRLSTTNKLLFCSRRIVDGEYRDMYPRSLPIWIAL
jgi:hypothetical protein